MEDGYTGVPKGIEARCFGERLNRVSEIDSCGCRENVNGGGNDGKRDKGK